MPPLLSGLGQQQMTTARTCNLNECSHVKYGTPMTVFEPSPFCNGTDFTTERETSCCGKLITNNSDSEQQKVNFLNGLLLKSSKHQQSEQPLGSLFPDSNQLTDPKLLRWTKIKLVKLFHDNPLLEFSSILGQNVIRESTKCDEEGQPTIKYSQLRCTVPQKEEEKNPIPIRTRTNSRRKKPKVAEYFHKATFNRRQRIIRKSELVLGLNQNTWGKFNQCKKVRLVLPVLTDGEIAKEMSSRPPSPPKKPRVWNLVVRLKDITQTPFFINNVIEES